MRLVLQPHHQMPGCRIDRHWTVAYRDTMTRRPHYSEIVAAFGERLFGREWGKPLARLTGANGRTVQRVMAAARDGREYPAARGILAALHEQLSPIARELRPHARRAAQQPTQPES